MLKERICPLMSRPVQVWVSNVVGQSISGEHFVPCQKEKCALWIEVMPDLLYGCGHSSYDCTLRAGNAAQQLLAEQAMK
jgi:hypothetical protein